MGKNKLKKFAEMETFSCVFQYPFGKLREESFPLKGRWGADYFGNDNPIVLELGCGKGEYTVGLAQHNPQKNYIGIDIKGARIWKGAKQATEQEMRNVAFLRTGIELLPSFFAPGEVSEIWITFPDPQMQKCRKRLVSARFLTLYQQVMVDGGEVHLKTDSPFLYEFACRLVDLNQLPVTERSADLYGSGMVDEAKAIKTFYEQQWLSRGKKIKLLSFHLPKEQAMTDPAEDDIERDDYHSYPRGIIQEMPDQLKNL
jgi:tRNA (guanine-N7-)-methyltransferase